MINFNLIEIKKVRKFERGHAYKFIYNMKKNCVNKINTQIIKGTEPHLGPQIKNTYNIYHQTANDKFLPQPAMKAFNPLLLHKTSLMADYCSTGSIEA